MSCLTLRFFGPPEVRLSDGTLLPPPRTRKGLWLLALLVLRAGKTVERVWLAGQLWPDTPTESGLANLRRSLTDLRKLLGPDAACIASPTATTLVFEERGVDCDVLAFDTDPLSPLALSLYRGTLLEGCDEEWVIAERRQRDAGYREQKTRAEGEGVRIVTGLLRSAAGNESIGATEGGREPDRPLAVTEEGWHRGPTTRPFSGRVFC